MRKSLLKVLGARKRACIGAFLSYLYLIALPTTSIEINGCFVTYFSISFLYFADYTKRVVIGLKTENSHQFQNEEI